MKDKDLDKDLASWKMHEKGNLISWERVNEGGYFCGVDIVKNENVVWIWVEDSYYNFKIPFDMFLEIAKKIKEAEKENMDNATKYARQYRYAKNRKR